MDKYLINDKKIGRGAVGNVYKVINISSGEKYALKTVLKKSLNYREILIKNEIEIQSKLDHPNIVKIVETFIDEEKVCIVMELCQENLYEYAKKTKFIEEDEALNIFKQIVNAVKYMHQNNITHRDIKTDNVMKFENNWKLIDFGFASEEKLFEDAVGTIDYLAPEIVRKEKFYGFPVDVWTLGITLYDILFLIPPFFQKSYSASYNSILYNEPRFSSRALSLNIENLIVLMLNKNPKERITIDEIFFKIDQ